MENRPMAVGGHLRVWIDDGDDGLVRIRLAGELDIGTVTQLKQAVDAYARHGQTMIIDLREVDLIDSMGLAALVRARHRAVARGGRLALVSPPPHVRAVFGLTRLDGIFTWTAEEAPCPGS
jgi:anti-sigma B factor antagonist